MTTGYRLLIDTSLFNPPFVDEEVVIEQLAAGTLPDRHSGTIIGVERLFDVDAGRFKPRPDDTSSEWLSQLIWQAVRAEGAHHKQWYLEQLAARLGVELGDHEPGVAP